MKNAFSCWQIRNFMCFDPFSHWHKKCTFFRKMVFSDTKRIVLTQKEYFLCQNNTFCVNTTTFCVKTKHIKLHICQHKKAFFTGSHYYSTRLYLARQIKLLTLEKFLFMLTHKDSFCIKTILFVSKQQLFVQIGANTKHVKYLKF